MKSAEKSRVRLLTEVAELKKRLAASEELSAALDPPNDSMENSFKPSEVSLRLKDLEEKRAMEPIKTGRRQTRIPDKYLRTIFDAAPAGISVATDISCRVIRHNPAAARFFRIGQDECPSFLSATRPNFKMLYQGRELLPEEMPIKRAAWRGEVSEGLELEFVWEDGVRKTALWNANPLFGDDGCITGAIAAFEDITERKRAEEVLKRDRKQLEGLVKERTRELVEANEKVSMILESISEAFYAVDADWRITYMNNRAKEIWNHQSDDVIGKLLWDLFPGQENNRTCLHLQRAMRDCVPVSYESRFPYGGISIEANAYPLDEGGLAVFFRDITERKQLENDLFTSRELLMNFIDSTHSIIYARDLEGKLLMLNQTLSDYYKLPKEKALGTTFYDLLNRAEAESLITNDNVVIATGTPHQFEELVTHDGEQKTFTANKFPLRDAGGCIYGVGAVITDITRKKQGKEKLRQSEERFFKAFHSSPVMMSIALIENNILLDVNETWSRTMGVSRTEARGRTGRELGLTSPPNQSPDYVTILQREGNLRGKEMWFRTVNGEDRIGIFSKENIEMNGVPCRLVTIQDITEIRRIEREITRLDKLNLVGEMAASIGHEIRNPMTTIRGFLQMLSERDENSKNQDYYGLMIEELDRANTIITDYLSMAKDKTIELQPRYLNSIVRAILPMIQADASLKDMQVRLDLDYPPKLWLDEKEVRQLIINLARNGMEAMMPGGTLTIRTRVDDSEVVLEVEDQGGGIPPEILERLGTPFQTTKENGTGLGLPVCYSIAQRHNAKLDVETGSGGTTFRVRFKKIENKVH